LSGEPHPSNRFLGARANFLFFLFETYSPNPLINCLDGKPDERMSIDMRGELKFI
jgi:hypothetical protein